MPGLTAEAVLRAVLGRDLGSQLPLPAAPLDEAVWFVLSSTATAERLWGEVADAIATGDLVATDEQASAVHEHHVGAMGTALELEALALDVVDLLAREGLEVRIIKGLATAHLDHPDPARRSFGDVDLLVAPGRFRDTIDVLEANGWQRDLPERRPGFDERFGKDGTLQRERWGQVDLHRTLTLGPFGLWIDLDELWAGSEPFALADRTVEALDPPRRLLHACYAAVLTDPVPRLSLLRDVALLAAEGPGVLAEAIELSRRWRGEAVLSLGLNLAIERLGIPATPHAYEPSRAEHVALHSYDSQGGSNTRLLLTGALALPTWRDRAAYLRALLLPTRSYREARRTAGRGGEWRQGFRELIGRK